MFKHHFSHPTQPNRVVTLGSQGFVAGTLGRLLRAHGVPLLALGQKELDLLDTEASAGLASQLRAEDALVFVSKAHHPKHGAMVENNIAMANAVLDALRQNPVAHVLYISSDAVYQDSQELITEFSPAAPNTLHGAMHLTRELMLQSELNGKIPLAILRPTLIYGANSPHNGYGANRFARLAAKGEEIVLFGEGEEQRDHVSVDDVAELARRILFHRSFGILNAVTGITVSFRELAEYHVELAGGHSIIRRIPRNGVIHNPCRAFDITTTRTVFPDFQFVSWQNGVRRMASELKAKNRDDESPVP